MNKNYLVIGIVVVVVLIGGYLLMTKAPSNELGMPVPGLDTPEMIVEEAVSPVQVGDSDMGVVLVGENRMTLYTFTNDEVGKSNCYDACAVNWPPLLTNLEEAAQNQELDGEVETIHRDDTEMHQVTYNGMPLYFWINDKMSGDTTGDGVNNVWFVAKP